MPRALRRTECLVAGLLCVGYGVSVAKAEEGKWIVEPSSVEVIISISSDTQIIDHGEERSAARMIMNCRRSNKKTNIRFVSSISRESTLIVRFGGGSPHRYSTLIVPLEDHAAFLAEALANQQMRIRFESQKFEEAVFDLRGLKEAIRPFVEACDLAASLEAAAAAPAPAAEPSKPAEPKETTVGSWHLRETASSIDDKPNYLLSATSSTGTHALLLRCLEGTADAYVVGEMFFRESGAPPFQVSFDAGETQSFESSRSRDGKALFFNDARSFIRAAKGHRAVTLTVPAGTGKLGDLEALGKPLERTFSITGLETALAGFEKRCVVKERP